MNSRITRPNASSIRSAVSITDEIETIYDEITRRAYELFLAHRGEGALDVEDWLLAERELLIKPPASVYRSGNRIKVTVGLGGVQPAFVEIVIAGQTLLIHSLKSPTYPKIFRTVHLPAPIDADRAQVRFEARLLCLTADVRV